MPKKQSKKDVTIKKNPPTPAKVLSLLSSEGVTRRRICQVLAAGLKATRPVVADGEILQHVPDYSTRHKYIETILDVIGEKKLVIPTGDTHYHFTNILSLVEAYERGDKRAIDDARKIFEASGISDGEMEGRPEKVLPGSFGDQADVGTPGQTSKGMPEGDSRE